MNEAEAFEAWLESKHDEGFSLKEVEWIKSGARLGWQAALEWQRSQCEPVGWRVSFTKAPRGNFQEGRPGDQTIVYWQNRGIDIEYCYASTPTAQINEQMREALMHAQRVLNHNNLALECAPINEAIKQAALAAATPK